MNTPRVRILIHTIALVAVLLAPTLAAAAARLGEVVVLTGEDSMTVDIDLKPLEPLSPALRALLAFYAMRANGGCPPGDWSADGKIYEMSCPLTTALGLGFQCSEAQISLVRTWFKDGAPPLLIDLKTATRIGRSVDFASTCAATPYTATHQTIWSSIRVLSGKDGVVTIEGEGEWTAGPGADSGSFKNTGTYQLLPDRVRVLNFRAK
jgi:hypothetical protein